MRSARLAAAAFALALGLAPSRASACRNVVLRFSTTELVARAEAEVDRGNTGEAAARIRGAFPDVRTLGPDAPPIALRAQRIYAVALVRADGQLDSQLGWTRWANYEWAIATLEELDARRPNDPRAQADLAEARLRLPRTRERGVAVLEDLDRRDLLPGAFAYAALARARVARHDAAGARAALRRCLVATLHARRCDPDDV